MYLNIITSMTNYFAFFYTFRANVTGHIIIFSSKMLILFTSFDFFLTITTLGTFMASTIFISSDISIQHNFALRTICSESLSFNLLTLNGQSKFYLFLTFCKVSLKIFLLFLSAVFELSFESNLNNKIQYVLYFLHLTN